MSIMRTAMHTQPLSAQRGAATIIMSVLVGFSITAMGLALMFNVQNAQDKQITAQAQVSAQNLAWAGSEAIRQVLTAMPLKAVDELTANQVLPTINNSNVKAADNVASIQGAITPTIVSNLAVATANGVAKHKEITVNLAAVNAPAGVGTNLQLVYGIFNEPAVALPALSPLTFYHDADIQAVADFKNKTTAGAAITIKGSVTLTNQVSGLDSVEATENITVGNNGIKLKSIKANGVARVTSDAKVIDSVTGLKKVEIDPGFTTHAYSNGDLLYKSSDPDVVANNKVAELKAGGAVSVNNFGKTLGFGTIESSKTVTLTNCNTAKCFETIRAEGILSVDLAKVDSAFSKTQITCTSAIPIFQQTAANLSPSTEAVAPNFVGCDKALGSSKFRKEKPAFSLSLNLTPVEIAPLIIDVWEHEANANYVVRYDGTKTLITVKNVSRAGTALTGQYRLVYDGMASKGYLCPLTDTDIACKSAIFKNVICTGTCWSVQAATSSPGASPYTFTLSGATLAPGVYIFDGNLSLKANTLSSATLLAAGFISTEGNSGKAGALNYAGPSGGTYAGSTLKGVCSTDLNLNLIPSNFCANGFDPTAANNLGNVALMAGGYPRTITSTTEATYNASDKASETKVASTDSSGRTKYTITRVTPDAANNKTITQVIALAPYRGGDILLAADNVIFGSVLAGNMLKTSGTTKIYGYVVSAALARTPPSGGGSVLNEGGLNMTINQISASTTVDNSIGPATFDGKVVPGALGNSTPPATQNDVRVLRSRYL